MTQQQWRMMKGYEVEVTPKRPGVYALRSGGYLVRIKSRDPKTGKARERLRTLPGATLQEALEVRDQHRAELRGATRTMRQTMLWSEFAASLFERKVAGGELRSAATIEQWDSSLRLHLVPALGHYPCNRLRYADLEAWRTDVAKRILAGELSPHTAAGWVRIVKHICRRMTAELELGRNPAEIIRGFDADPYSDEEPNALVVEQAQAFLAAMREDYPQHYAMTLLGFVTGLRPSSLRSLRRVEDVLWDEGAILVRRSNARGQVVAERTKTGRRQRIHLPESVMQTLREHVALLKHPPISPVFKQPPMWWRKPMADSPLLFPARTGGFRSRSCLDKPFADVCKTAGITHAFTPRGMRRTFQDLARAAEVHDVVTRSISGHATTRMHEHYSTAAANEQRTAVAKVIDLVSRRRAAG